MNKKYLLTSVLFFGLSIIFILNFSPRDVALIFTLVPTFGLSASVYFLIKATIDASGSEPRGALRYLPMGVGVGFALLLILSSLGQLSVASFLLILTLAVLTSLFLDRIRPS